MSEITIESLSKSYDAYEKEHFPEGFLDAYTLLECLGERSGIDTFVCAGKQGGEYVAKCYSRDSWDIDAAADILSGLCIEGVPQHVADFRNDTLTVTVREYIEGVPLDRYALENDLTQEQIVDVCVKLCGILEGLHHRKEPIIHRDIKPQNVIVKEDGSIYLIDFDVARVYSEERDTDTRFFGTPAYAPPEQYGFTQTDARADIYALGILLRYLLTGSTRENANIRLYAPLAKIISKCTAFAPEDRYADVAEVKEALLKANPKAQHVRAGKFAGAAVLALVLIGVIGYQIYSYVTFDPFGEGHIPSVLQDEERAADAVSYLADKYGTHMFDDTGDYVTMGMMRDALSEIYGFDYDYAHAISDADPPDESDKWFFPWGKGNEQYITQYELAYAVVKVYWPDVVTDWSSLKEDNGEYPGSVVAYNWCQKYGIFTGVKRPYDMTQGEAAIAFANADRVYEAMKEQEKK